MDSDLNASVSLIAGRLSGRICSEIPIKIPTAVLLNRMVLWEKMQKKYELLEQYSTKQGCVPVRSLGLRCLRTVSSRHGVVMQSTHIESPGRASHNYSHYPERRVLRCKRNNRSLNDIQVHLSDVVETLSQSGSHKPSGCLGHKDKSVLPMVCIERCTSALTVNKHDEIHDAENMARTVDVSKCTPLQSEKQDIINDSDKICSFGSQSIPSCNRNSQESPDHLVMPQQYGKNKVTRHHCTSDASSLGFETNRKGRKETSQCSYDDENKDVTDDDDIFYSRHSQCPPLHYEKEDKSTKKTFCLNSQSRYVRDAGDNKISGLSVSYEHLGNNQTVVSSGSGHITTTQAPHDDANMTKKNVPVPRTRRNNALNHSASSGDAESEDYKTADSENPTQRNAGHQRNVTRKTPHNFHGSHCGGGGNPKKLSVLMRDRSSDAASDHTGAGDGENEVTGASGGSSFIFSDSLEKEFLTPMWKRRSSSDYLFGSGHDRIGVITDCGKNENNGKGRKRQISSSCNSGAQELDENKEHTINDNNPKDSMFYKRKGSKNISDCITSAGVESKGGITDDGQMANRNDITSRKRWAKSLSKSVESKQDETAYDRSHDGSHIKRENVSHQGTGTNISCHITASDHGKNENKILDDGEYSNSENILRRSKRGMKLHNNLVRSKNNKNEGNITDSKRDLKKRNVVNRRETGTETSSHYLIDSKKGIIFNRRKSTETPEHGNDNDDDDDDDDSIFYNPSKRSWFNEMEIPGNNISNRNSTILKSSRSDTTHEPCQNSAKLLFSEKEDKTNNVSGSEEASTAVLDLDTESYGRQISGHVTKQFPSDKYEDNIRTEPKLMEKRRTEPRKGLPTGADLQNKIEIMEYDDDDDDIFICKILKHSGFIERGKIGNTIGNRNSNLLKSSGSNTSANVASSHSQMLLTRSDTTYEPCQNSVKQLFSEKEDKTNNVSGSEEASTAVLDLVTDSYGRQISGHVIKQFPNDDK